MQNQTQKRKEKPQDIHANNLQLLKDRIKEKQTEGCYIFYGDEEYTKNHYTNLLIGAADSSLNVSSIYGKDFTLEGFISACETSAVESFDMFSMDEPDDDDDGAFRVVKLYAPDLSVLSKKDADQLLSFLQDLPEKTIVIFMFQIGAEETVLKNNFYKSVGEFALTVNFRREPVGSSVLITWILRHFSKEKITVDRHVAVHLCQTVGNSMTDLKNEIDKLIDYLRFENRDVLQKDDIEFICIKSAEAQIFDIADGALSGDFVKAARALGIIRDKRDSDLSPVNVAATISKAVNTLCVIDNYIRKGTPIATIAKEMKLHEFTVKKNASILTSRGRDFKGKDSYPATAARLCMEYDQKIKSSRTNGYELLLELLFKLSFAGKDIS